MSLNKLEQTEINIISDLNVVMSKNISLPLLKLGYNYELNDLRIKYNLLKDKEYQIKLHNDMNELTNKYLNKELILTNVFYKYWELFVIFKIINKDKKNILLINDYDTNIYLATTNFKEKIYFKNTDDITIYNINKSDDKKIKNKNEYDIIICNSDIINIDDVNYKEQYLYDLKLFELITVLKNQKKNGFVIFKYYDLYTFLSQRIINILQSYYESVYIYVPKIEDKNSDKFIICADFKGINKTELKNIEKIHKDTMKNDKLFILDIVNNDIENYKLEENIRNINININIKIIDNIKKYIYNIEKDDMTEILYNREKLNEFWVNKFYPVNEKELDILRNKN